MSASEFSKLVFDISQKLSRENVEALKYLYKAYYPENATNLGVLTALENRGVFSSRNIEGLRVLLCDIHRCDLLELLKAAEDKRLQLCYYQAMSIEKQLEMIRTELENFCSKHEECSPTDRHFCGKITDRVEKVQREMREYLTTPLKEVCAASHSKGERKEAYATIFNRITGRRNWVLVLCQGAIVLVWKFWGKKVILGSERPSFKSL